jgi:hypothetical protein
LNQSSLPPGIHFLPLILRGFVILSIRYPASILSSLSFLPLSFSIMTNLPLNRKPITLAGVGMTGRDWQNVAECAYSRKRYHAKKEDYAACAREWTSVRMAWDAAHDAMADPFPPKLPEGLTTGTVYHPSDRHSNDPEISCVRVSRSWHLAQTVGEESKAMELPSYLQDAVDEEREGWRDLVCSYLSAVDDFNRPYTFRYVEAHEIDFGDLDGEFNFTIFYPKGEPDSVWANCYIALDNRLYDLTDSSVADCGILNTTINWRITGLNGEQLPENLSFPTGDTIRRPITFIGRPVWHHGLSCFVGRLRACSFPVKIFALPPLYG